MPSKEVAGEPTTFQQSVWKILEKIPSGRVTTYAEIAKAIQKPKASRAVGNACNQNPDSPRVPCHRVVKSNGEIGGYAGGNLKKIKLLEREGIQIQNGRIIKFKERLIQAGKLG